MLGLMIYKAIRYNIRVTAWIFVTLLVCSSLVTVFTGINLELRPKMSVELRRIGANAVAYPIEVSPAVQLKKTNRTPDWNRAKDLVRRYGGVITVLEVGIGLIEGQPVTVVAADPGSLRYMAPYWKITGKRAVSSNECLVGRRAAKLFELEIGNEVTVEWIEESRASVPISTYRIAGIVDCGDDDDNRIFVGDFSAGSNVEKKAVPQFPDGHPIVKNFVGDNQNAPGDNSCRSCHSVIPKLDSSVFQGKSELPSADFTYGLLSVPTGKDGIDNLNRAFRSTETGIEIKPLRQVLYGERAILGKINLLAGLAMSTVVVLTGMGVSAAVLAWVAERRRELALLQSLGATRRAVALFLLTESLVIGASAAICGFILGTVIAGRIVYDVFHVAMSPHGEALAAAVVTTIVVALVAGMVASGRALNIPPAVALKQE